MAQEFIGDLKNRIIAAVKEIFKEAYCKNIENPNKVYPLLISENDLTCELYKRLSKYPDIRITTEVGKKRRRNDIGIFPADQSFPNPPCGCYYRKSRYGNPTEWDCDKYLALIEIKNNWFGSKNYVKDALIGDLDALLDVKDKAYLLMEIFFDYRDYRELPNKDISPLLKDLLNKDEYDKIDFIYGNLKQGKLLLKINQKYKTIEFSYLSCKM